MATDTHELVPRALARLRDTGIFITVEHGPRTGIDQLLYEIMAQWAIDHPVPGLHSDLEYRVVAASSVHALVVAVGPDAVHHVEVVATRHLAPFIMFTDGRLDSSHDGADDGAVVSRRRRWRTFLLRFAALVRVFRGRRRAP